VRIGPKEIWKVAKNLAHQESVDALIASFEAAAQETEEGTQFWLARDLSNLLGYAKYDNFLPVIEKAKVACVNAGAESENHFLGVRKMVSIGSGAERETDDVMLTRYACYLIAQNSDARKKPVAFAQTYFAIQTRRQELNSDPGTPPTALTEDERRILLRDEIKGHNRKLSSTAKSAGVVTSSDFANFHSSGYQGLYGGLTKIGIQKYKGLTSKQDILDHMGSTELAANLFRLTQTEEKLRKEKIQGKENANRTHYEVGRKVRNTMQQISGTVPENLPAVEHVKEARKRIKETAKKQIR
jgi:DNA-damage-inducible protein D